MSLPVSRILAAGLAALVVAGSATQAFALRNRYTNEPIEGFTGLLFGDYGDDALPGRRPAYRRGTPLLGAAPGYDDDDAPAYRGPRRSFEY